MYNDINEAMVGLSVWKKQRRKTVKRLSGNIAYKPTFEADSYREAAMYRFIEMAESAFNLYKDNLLVGSIVAARAAQEALAVMWYVNSKLVHFSATKDLDHFSERMGSLITGWSKDEELPENTNLMTCIKSVDEEMEGKFMWHYNMLSEYAHANYSGTFGTYAVANPETMEVTFGESPRSEETLKSHIEYTLILCVGLLDSIQESYEKVIDDALGVCHRIHKYGKVTV